MSTASILLDDLAQAWEDAIQEAPQEGDTFIYKSPLEDAYSIGMARWGLRPDQYRILERAPKPEPKPRAVMASSLYDPEHRREVYVETPGENWESHLRYAESGELVDPVEMVELPSREELLEALGRAYDAWAQEVRMTRGADGHRADAVLELLRGER